MVAVREKDAVHKFLRIASGIIRKMGTMMIEMKARFTLLLEGLWA
jgi:hypothetical protein